MTTSRKRVRTRFAPSPTGLLHIGGVRTALFSFLLARHYGGDFVLRIEDTDRERLVEGGVDQILESLAWLGLNPDEGPNTSKQLYGPYVQSERNQQGLYAKFAQQLVEEGRAYYSAITPGDFAELKAQAIAAKKPFVYRQSMEPAQTGATDNLPIRLKVTQGELIWQDAVHGEFKVNHDIIDDFVIMKADGYPTYNFANVVDDHLMEISHVVRGPEFLASTPKHALLYDYLGWGRPVFAHCPTILGPDGKKKLSKRDGDVDALEYRTNGFLPAAVLNFLAMLGWNDGTTQEIFTLSELADKFSLERIQKSPAQFDVERLKWMNGEYIRNVITQDDYLGLARGALQQAPYQLGTASDEYIDQVLLLDRERVKTLVEIPDIVELFFVTPKTNHDFVELLTAKSSREDAKTWLNLVIDDLSASDFSETDIEARLRGLAEKHDLHTGKLFYTIRIAITGRTSAPGLFETLALLGKVESLGRLRAATSAINA